MSILFIKLYNLHELKHSWPLNTDPVKSDIKPTDDIQTTDSKFMCPGCPCKLRSDSDPVRDPDLK